AMLAASARFELPLKKRTSWAGIGVLVIYIFLGWKLSTGPHLTLSAVVLKDEIYSVHFSNLAGLCQK
ncbi:MAG TPA: hypothetical protein VN653_01635, partial [Anaerolineales bacterium]|nr:hypothetical protein [Anaerolineales bacterium]